MEGLLSTGPTPSSFKWVTLILLVPLSTITHFSQLMMDNANVTLEWKAFRPTIMNSFQNLYMDEVLADVTLACEGNHKILAHKVVLSACSNLFKQILANNKNPHPLIYLQGLDEKDLLLLKMSMYLGTATVEEKNVKTFMSVSKMYLNRYSDNHSMKETKSLYLKTETKPNRKLKFDNNFKRSTDHKTNIKIETEEHNIHNVEEINIEPKPDDTKPLTIEDMINIKGPIENQIIPPSLLCKYCNFRTNQKFKLKMHERKSHKEEIGHIYTHRMYMCEHCTYSTKQPSCFSLHMKRHNGKMIHCDQCDFQTTNNKHLSLHQDSRHNSTEYQCKICDTASTTMRALKFHIDKVHNGVRYNCKFCEYKATKISNLRSHERAIHDRLRYNCKHCTFGDSVESRLKMHTKRKHNIEQVMDSQENK